MPASHLSQRKNTRLGLCVALALAVGLLIFYLYLLGASSVARAESLGKLLYQASNADGQTNFTRDDGLVDNSVTALLRSDRLLWVGTMAGLSRYTVNGREAGLAWQTFTQKDGMAADAVTDLWTDNKNGLWVAHPNGQISFFDSFSWTVYQNVTDTLQQAYKQIVDDHAASPLWALEEGGRIWTLAEGTVGYYVGAVWRPYGEDAGIPRGRLVAVWTANGAWVASENGQLGYFDGANWATFGSVFDAVQRQYESIAASGPGTSPLWVVDQEGAVWARNAFNQRNPRPDVRRFAEGSWTSFGSGDGMASGFVEELRLDEFGRIWARHVADANGEGGGLSLYIPQESTQQTGVGSWISIIPGSNSNVTDFWPEGTEGVWIASFLQPETGGAPVGGLTYASLDIWQRFSLEALDGAAVSATWLDEDNTLWLGLSGDPRRGLNGGLWRYRPPQGINPARWTPVQGLLSDDVRDLWGDGRGNLWIANSVGVDQITLRNRRLVSHTQPIAPNRVVGDSAGNVWAVALEEEEQSVWQWDGDAWFSHTVSEGLSGGTFHDILALSDGGVYLAGDSGLDIWNGDSWETFAALPGRHVRRIWQDDTGDLWLSSEITPGRPFNLSLNQGSKWETILNAESSQRMGPEPLAIARDNRGRAWLGAPLGLFIYEPSGDSKWRGLGPAEGLPRGSVPALYKDATGTIWVAIGEQVYRTEHLPCGFDESALSLPVRVGGLGTQAGRGVCWDWVIFEPQVGVVNRIAEGPEGSVLFAGENGIALYNPHPPDLRLESVTNLISGEEVGDQERIVLTLGRNALQIDLVAIAPKLTAHEISYLYRLHGFNKDWRLATARSLGGKRASITYAGLPGGSYTFTVSARTDTLDASPEISFTLLVLSRPPQLFLDHASVAGRPIERPEILQSFVGEPIQVKLSSADDQLEPLAIRYRIAGLTDVWTTTTRSEISFTLSAAGTYTFVAEALDKENQSSQPVGARITVSEREQHQRTTKLPMEAVAAGLGILAVIFIGSAIVLTLRRRRRESW